jgi:glycosyltransferase involved in cell wall biosynthesis
MRHDSSKDIDAALPGHVADATAPPAPMKIAIVHDWLVTWGGSESAFAHLLALYPDAEVFALVDFMPPADRARLGLGARSIRTSFIQDLPGARRGFRRYLPLFPQAVERLDLSGFDLVLSSSHAVAKGVRTRPSQLHICYCYTPMRYAWDLRESYLAQVGLDRGVAGWFVRRSLAHLRRWDAKSSSRVTHFVAISNYIAQRIQRCYGRTATVIYPPVDIGAFDAAAPRGPAYVTVSRLVPYKRIDLIVAAFRDLPGHQLVVIGEGPERARIEALAGPNVRLLGQATDAERDHWLATGRAFIFAADEDFGIAPVEAHACGMPVIALGRGGALEIVRGLDSGAPTGVFFAEQTAQAIAAAVRQFEAKAPRITAQACRDSALRFSAERFRAEFAAFVHARQNEFATRAAA